MLQFAYKNKLYISGRIDNVTQYLRELSMRYSTVREYLQCRTKGL